MTTTKHTTAQGAEPAAQDQYLCQAWGETDLPVAAIVDGLEGVRAFLVAYWLGDADHEGYDGSKTLPAVMQQMQDDWAMEGEAWEWSAEFEIGGISVQKVFHAAAPQAPAAAPLDLSAFEKARFGVFNSNGRFEEIPEGVSPCGWADAHPCGHTARWVGGPSDVELLRAVFASAGHGRTQLMPAAAAAPLTQAARDVLAERRRQVEAEGWNPEHDDKNDAGTMAAAGASYAIEAYALAQGMKPDPNRREPWPWPWERAWWKPSAEPRRNLEKAGALILAEMERLDRAAARARPAASRKVP